MASASRRSGRTMDTFDALHDWSIADPAAFWSLVWDDFGIVGDKGARMLIDSDKMPGAQFFPDATLNYAENVLFGAGIADLAQDAMIFRGEDKLASRMSWAELRDLVSRLQQAFQVAGVTSGDRVAAVMPNRPETIAAMLAAASVGAVWSSCSPDYGERGILDRFGQVAPKLLIAADGYRYNGKAFDVGDKIAAVAAALPSLVATVIVPCMGADHDNAATVAKIAGGIALEIFLTPHTPKAPEFVRLPFSHPLFILFSSGTTGVPKCIVHGAGGTLLQHMKEHRLHCGLIPGDRVFYFSTCSWMMWNWLASALASGVTLLLYDGSPFYPDGNVLFDFASDEAMTFFGTSAKYIDAVRKAGLRPGESHDLSALRAMASTGSPLAPENFDFVYDAIKPDIHLASISGGTDIVSCFVLGVPSKPVFKGEIQGPGLGMAVDVWDDAGRPVRGIKGELVCTRPFPSMPVGFWNDADGSKYHAAYFDRFDNVWCHGDFAEWTGNGGMIIHGRSDATLNPGGVRIGTAEIYNQVEKMPQVLEAIAIGQQWDGDVRIVLFVRLADGVELTDDLISEIRNTIRTGASPRHMPARVVAVTDIPRTKSGKITELAVRDVVHGRAVRNVESLANPQALDQYRDLPELKT
ncbi:MAG: acetoacetate--CoA ligase [Alphaproteobacteria bacterium]